MRPPIRYRPACVWMVVMGWLACAAEAAPPEVRDDAGLFSVTAITQANNGIQDIKRSYQKDVHIETFKAVPAARMAEYKKDPKKFMAAWAIQTDARLKLDGVYIHIVKDPGHLEIILNTATQKKAFTTADRDKLRNLMVGHFKTGAFDKGLTEAVEFVRARLEQNLGPAYPAPVLNVVQDHGKFFTKESIDRAQAVIREFKQRFKTDVIVETFASPPPNKTVAEWVSERSKAARLEGAHILICKTPSRLHILVTEKTSKKAFSFAERDKLVELIISHFKARDFDKGLERGLDYVYDTVDKNITPPYAAPVIGEVRDAGKLFSPETLSQAREFLKTVQQDLGEPVTIQTYPRVPPGKVREVEAMTPEARNRFLADWLGQTRPTDQKAGLYILISRKPGKIQLALADPESKTITKDDADELLRLLRAEFKGEQFDQGLLKGLQLVTLRIVRNSGTPVVRDEAGFFKSDSLVTIFMNVRNISKAYKKTVRIETFATLPADRKEAYAKLAADDEKGREAFFADWQAERSKTTGADFHVLICKEPPRVGLAVSESAARQFNAADRVVVRDLLSKHLKEGTTDKGVVEAVAFIRDTLAAPAISDGAGLFSAGAIDKATAAIRDIQRRYQVPVLVETVKEVPAERSKGIDLSNAAIRGKFFAAWAEERQKGAGIDGISFLICKQPTYLQVTAGPQTGKRFGGPERDRVVKLLIAQFKAGNFDAGLAEALAYVDETLKSGRKTDGPTAGSSGASLEPAEKAEVIPIRPALVKRPVEEDEDFGNAPQKEEQVAQAKKDAQAPAPIVAKKESGGFDPMWIVWGLLILLGLWILIGVIRALSGAGRQQQQYYPPQQGQPGYGPPYGQPGYGGRPPHGYGGQYAPPPPQGGGGFMPGLLGGMFGAAAGSWLYDRFSGRGSMPPQAPAPQAPAPPIGQSPQPPPTEGYSSAGGDFGTPPADQQGYSSAGGDFGTPPDQHAGAGGDWGGQPPQQAGGGDWGQAGSTPESADGDGGNQGGSAGSDWGADQSTSGGAGGDWGTDSGGSAGGDWGGSDSSGSAGGDWGGGGGDSGGDSGGGGGDWTGSTDNNG